jgi:hypothetical protein
MIHWFFIFKNISKGTHCRRSIQHFLFQGAHEFQNFECNRMTCYGLLHGTSKIHYMIWLFVINALTASLQPQMEWRSYMVMWRFKVKNRISFDPICPISDASMLQCIAHIFTNTILFIIQEPNTILWLFSLEIVGCKRIETRPNQDAFKVACCCRSRLGFEISSLTIPKNLTMKKHRHLTSNPFLWHLHTNYTKAACIHTSSNMFLSL